MKFKSAAIGVVIIFIVGTGFPNLLTCQDSDQQDGWTIYPSGTFDLAYYGLVLKNCFPAINGQLIRPMSIKIHRIRNGGQIEYRLTSGKLILKLEKQNEVFAINATLEGWATAPEVIHPLASAEVVGANRFYRQGFGFAGPSGVRPLPKPIQQLPFADELKENVWSYDSYLFTGLMSKNDATLVISAFDHKNYLHRCTIYNRQYRFGLIDRHLDTDQIFFESGFATEEIGLPDKRLVLPTIYIQTGDNPYATFELQAKKLAAFNHVKLNIPPRYYFCSWYEFNKKFSEQILFEMLDEIEKMNQKPAIQAIQIDDGYCWYGDWLMTNDRYPSGMEAVVKKIKAHGYEAGIWIAPFMVSSNSTIFKEHPDWLLRDLTGKPIMEWDQEDEDVYVLDSSHPEALAYLRRVFNTFRGMGITSYKTDFMDWGVRDSKKVLRYRPGKTSIQYFVEVLNMIREEIGEESYWLGCIAPYQPMIGYADAMRLSNDVGTEWSDVSTGNMFREMYAGQFFNNILWQNDPDVLYLRDHSLSLSGRERQTIALWDGFLGGTLTTSCRFHTLIDEALRMWRFLKPGDSHHSARLPLWANQDSMLIAVRDYIEMNSKAILFVNPTERKLERNYALQAIAGMEKGFCFRWLPFQSKPMAELEQLHIHLEPHESALIYISHKNEPPPPWLGIAGKVFNE